MRLILKISLRPQAPSQQRARGVRVTLTVKAERNSLLLPSSQRTGGSGCWGPTLRALLPKPVADWRSSVMQRRVCQPPRTWQVKARRRKRMRQSGTRGVTATDWNRKTEGVEANKVGVETPQPEGREGEGYTTAGLWSSSWRVLWPPLPCLEAPASRLNMKPWPLEGAGDHTHKPPPHTPPSPNPHMRTHPPAASTATAPPPRFPTLLPAVKPRRKVCSHPRPLLCLPPCPCPPRCPVKTELHRGWSVEAVAVAALWVMALTLSCSRDWLQVEQQDGFSSTPLPSAHRALKASTPPALSATLRLSCPPPTTTAQDIAMACSYARTTTREPRQPSSPTYSG